VAALDHRCSADDRLMQASIPPFEQVPVPEASSVALTGRLQFNVMGAKVLRV